MADTASPPRPAIVYNKYLYKIVISMKTFYPEQNIFPSVRGMLESEPRVVGIRIPVGNFGDGFN